MAKPLLFLLLFHRFWVSGPNPQNAVFDIAVIHLNHLWTGFQLGVVIRVLVISHDFSHYEIVEVFVDRFVRLRFPLAQVDQLFLKEVLQENALFRGAHRVHLSPHVRLITSSVTELSKLLRSSLLRLSVRTSRRTLEFRGLVAGVVVLSV